MLLADGFERFHYESSAHGNQVLQSILNLMASPKMNVMRNRAMKVYMLADDVLAPALNHIECIEDNECDPYKGIKIMS